MFIDTNERKRKKEYKHKVSKSSRYRLNISLKKIKRKKKEEKERKKRKAASSQNQKRDKEKKLSLFFEIPTSHFHFRPITPVNGTNDHHDQKESRYWQRWRAGKDLDFEKKKKDRLKPRGGRERLTKRRASSKKSTSATNGSGRSVLLFQDFPGAVNFSSAPSGSIFARKYRRSLLFLFVLFKRKLHGWTVAAVYFDLFRFHGEK